MECLLSIDREAGIAERCFERRAEFRTKHDTYTSFLISFYTCCHTVNAEASADYSHPKRTFSRATLLERHQDAEYTHSPQVKDSLE